MSNDSKPVINLLTIRLIRSFEYRTFKNLILKNIPADMTFTLLKGIVQDKIKTANGFKIYQDNDFDTFKIYMYPHGAKTSNLIINLDHPDWLIKDEGLTLADFNVTDETEISFFNRSKFEHYASNPEIKW